VNRRQRHRRGAAMVVLVLTCLLVVSVLARSMTQATLRSRRLVRMEHQMRQTELLLDAGVLRAASRLKIDPTYPGETWQPTTAIERFHRPRVEIQVTNAADDPLARLIEVTASLRKEAEADDLSGVSQTRRSHAFQIKLSTSSNTE
jgi:hypothetical protein